MISVVMPLLRAKRIAWLALEGLCRQEKAGKWELIVIEEYKGGVGERELRGYYDRLKTAGCVNLRYIELNAWIPLSQKYALAGGYVSGRIVVIQSGDDYPHPERLRVTRELIGRYGLYQQTKGTFYDIELKQMIAMDWELQCRHPCCLNMAYKSGLFKLLPEEFRCMGVDGWMYRSIFERKRFETYFDSNEYTGLYTNGLNQISIARIELFAHPTGMFTETSKTLYDCVPEDIARKLEPMQIRRTTIRAGKYEN